MNNYFITIDHINRNYEILRNFIEDTEQMFSKMDQCFLNSLLNNIFYKFRIFLKYIEDKCEISTGKEIINLLYKLKLYLSDSIFKCKKNDEKHYTDEYILNYYSISVRELLVKTYLEIDEKYLVVFIDSVALAGGITRDNFNIKAVENKLSSDYTKKYGFTPPICNKRHTIYIGWKDRQLIKNILERCAKTNLYFGL